MKQQSTSNSRNQAIAGLFLLLGTTAGIGQAADCTSLLVQTKQQNSAIFVDGFETGDLTAWGSAPAFSAGDVLDLDFVVDIDDPLNGDHVLELKIYTPNGHLYQSLAVPITPEVSKRGQLVRMPGFPRAVEVQVLEGSRAGAAKAQGATLSLPVGGTSIATTSIYGTWTVEPFLDWQPVTCGEAASFVIVE